MTPRTTRTTLLNAEALRQVLIVEYLWHYPMIKDLIQTVMKKEAEMRSAGEIE